MVDTPTTRNRLRKQELGSNTNTWGDKKLNEMLTLVDIARLHRYLISSTATGLLVTNPSALWSLSRTFMGVDYEPTSRRLAIRSTRSTTSNVANRQLQLRMLNVRRNFDSGNQP